MDVPSDSKEFDLYWQMMHQLRDNARKANANKGKKPTYHPPAQLQLEIFMNAKRSRPARTGKDYSNQTFISQMPQPYPPCLEPAEKLRPMTIAEMTLETHHRGRQVLVRVISPADRINAVMAVVEDERGTATMLQLYNQPPELLVPAAEIVWPGRVAIIKDPFFKATRMNNSYSLRVDHFSDIIWLDSDDHRMPSRWRDRSASRNRTSEDLRTQGNNAVRRQNWAEAERLYTAAILAAKTSQEKHLAFLNRCHVNIKLQWPEAALKDARAANQESGPSEKGLFREARALYETGQFRMCLDKLRELMGSYPNNAAAKAEVARAEARLAEQGKGQYSFSNMYRQAKATPPIVDCATYVGPVEVRASPGRGHGLFTTQRVAAGQLLLCEKAFAYSYASPDYATPGEGSSMAVLMNLATNRITIGGQALLIPKIVQLLYKSPEMSRGFFDLWKGNYETPVTSNSRIDGVPIVDSFMVERAVCLNSFVAPRTKREFFQCLVNNQKNGKESGVSTASGIWLLASAINHSCLVNCGSSFIGDMQIIRACQDLEAGTELVISYVVTDEKKNRDKKRQSMFSSWGFECGCTLCVANEATPATRAQKRQSLVLQLEQTLNRPHVGDSNLARAQRLMQQLESLSPAGGPRTHLCKPYLIMAKGMIAAGRHGDAMCMVARGLEALDFVLDAAPPRRGQPARLEIQKWGQPTFNTIMSLLMVLDICDVLAPELCEKAKRYMELAYRIVLGEGDTLAELFPMAGYSSN